MNYILTDKEPKLPLKYFEDKMCIRDSSQNLWQAKRDLLDSIR